MSPQIITLGQLPRVKVNNSTESGVGASLAKHALQFSTSVERRSDGVSQPSRTNVLFMGAVLIRPEHARFKWPPRFSVGKWGCKINSGWKQVQSDLLDPAFKYSDF